MSARVAMVFGDAKIALAIISVYETTLSECTLRSLFSFLGDVLPPSLPFSLSLGEVKDSIECLVSFRHPAATSIAAKVFILAACALQK